MNRHAGGSVRFRRRALVLRLSVLAGIAAPVAGAAQTTAPARGRLPYGKPDYAVDCDVNDLPGGSRGTNRVAGQRAFLSNRTDADPGDPVCYGGSGVKRPHGVRDVDAGLPPRRGRAADSAP